MIYKAISIRQPYASLIANGEKTIEIRSRPTYYRGDLLIVSSASVYRLNSQKRLDLPYGKALTLVNLADCRPMQLEDEEAACCEYQSNAYSWLLNNIRPIINFPVKGALGFYNVECKTPLIFCDPPDISRLLADLDAIAKQD